VIGAVGFPPPAAPPNSSNPRGLPVTDQELIWSALRQVDLIVAEHLESDTRDADDAVAKLVAILVCSKNLKSDHSGDEVRPGWRLNE
jgi:hypothetical protein